jgi:hypothetical protein
MPDKSQLVPPMSQIQDGSLQVEMAITLRPRRAKASSMQVEHAGNSQIPPPLPRVTRLMALAIKFQDMVDTGEVQDYADLARLGYVTRARLTQIMNLILLAPDLQEQLLFSAVAGHERLMRKITTIVAWSDQRVCWPVTQSDQGHRVKIRSATVRSGKSRQSRKRAS